jgi:hypothetical protein
MTLFRPVTATVLSLNYPMSLAVYDGYPDAQRAVDFLADHDFPVSNVTIVGTDLRSIERVTGRLTRGKVAAAGAISGVWLGLFVGLALSLIDNQGSLGILATMPLGAAFGLIWSQIGYAAATRGGARDFSSISQIVATRYEVLVEHHYADQARAILTDLPAS